MDIDDLAGHLRDAWQQRRQIAPPDDLDLTTAYRIQDALLTRVQRGGAEVSGGKIGLSNPRMFETFGVSEPVSGVLFDDLRLSSGAVLPASAYCAPRVEGELCFTLSRDLDDPDMPLEVALGAIDSVAPAIEIVDSRWTGTAPQIAAIVAENVSASWYVMGNPVRLAPGDLEGLAHCGLTLAVDDQQAATGEGSAAFGGPVQALQWLACNLARRGWPLRAGHHVMSGAFAPMYPVQPGQHVVAAFPGIGQVDVTFAGD
jgi:2-keto-4-pentenoate hydratase